MNANNFLKKSSMLMVVLLLCNVLVAQDRIIFTWRSSHGDYSPSSAFLVIRATNSESFTIDWGDNSPIETKTGLGNIDIVIGHGYWSHDGKATVTIVASSADCKFTYFDCHTRFADDWVTFQIETLTLDECSDLEYLYCDYNSLQLSDLYAASLIIKEQSGRLFGSQYLLSQPLTSGMTVDFSAQNMIGGVQTFFQVWKKWYKPAIFNVDYTIDNGVITFITDGEYIVEMTNGAIIPHPNYPVKVVAGMDRTGSGINILENSLPNIKIYPNPVSNVVYIQTESETIPELKLYSLDGKLLQQLLNTEIDLSNYAEGFYLLSIDGQTVKIMKQ